jgi:DNA-binding MarR family transcriptional regulator
MWIRLLAVTRATENHLRAFLRVNHATTLPRFDAMAALHRKPGGVTMSELSRMLLVSNGNSTAVVDRLENDGLARRASVRNDRRAVLVSLTKKGLRQFESLAEIHEREIEAVFADLSEAELETMIGILTRHSKGATA